MTDGGGETPKPRRGGRPLLGVKPTLVRLPEGVPERIDVVAGKHRRAEFIREATVAELERRETAAPDKPEDTLKPPTK